MLPLFHFSHAALSSATICGSSFRKVVFLAHVPGEVIKLPAALPLRFKIAPVHQFPLPPADGLLRAEVASRVLLCGAVVASPVKCRRRFTPSASGPGSAPATAPAVGRMSSAIPAGHRSCPRVLCQARKRRRDADAAFDRLALVAAQGSVDAGVVGEEGFAARAAVVAEEEDQGVLVLPRFAKLAMTRPTRRPVR